VECSLVCLAVVRLWCHAEGARRRAAPRTRAPGLIAVGVWRASVIAWLLQHRSSQPLSSLRRCRCRRGQPVRKQAAEPALALKHQVCRRSAPCAAASARRPSVWILRNWWTSCKEMERYTFTTRPCKARWATRCCCEQCNKERRARPGASAHLGILGRRPSRSTTLRCEHVRPCGRYMNRASSLGAAQGIRRPEAVVIESSDRPDRHRIGGSGRLLRSTVLIKTHFVTLSRAGHVNCRRSRQAPTRRQRPPQRSSPTIPESRLRTVGTHRS